MPIYSLSRYQIKRQGGKMVDFCRHGDVGFVLWQMPNGTLYTCSDWYRDTQAYGHLITKEAWDKEHETCPKF